MSFKSTSLESQANSSINDLINNLLPNVTNIDENGGKKKQSNIENLTNTYKDLDSNRLTAAELKRLKKKQRNKTNKELNKNARSNIKINEKAKIKIIQNRIKNVNSQAGPKDYNLTSEEKKLINNLIDNNVESLKLSDRPKEELGQLELEILAMTDKQKTKFDSTKNKRLAEVSMQKRINGQMKRVHAYPGLTPGLAPVDLDDSDDESD